MENSEALVLFSELSRATVESRLKAPVQGSSIDKIRARTWTHGLWKWGRDRRARDRHIVSFFASLTASSVRVECMQQETGSGAKFKTQTAMDHKLAALLSLSSVWRG